MCLHPCLLFDLVHGQCLWNISTSQQVVHFVGDGNGVRMNDRIRSWWQCVIRNDRYLETGWVPRNDPENRFVVSESDKSLSKLSKRQRWPSGFLKSIYRRSIEPYRMFKLIYIYCEWALLYLCPVYTTMELCFFSIQIVMISNNIWSWENGNVLLTGMSTHFWRPTSKRASTSTICSTWKSHYSSSPLPPTTISPHSYMASYDESLLIYGLNGLVEWWKVRNVLITFRTSRHRGLRHE